MKKIFTILCAGMLAFSVSAQTDAGNTLVGVNSNFGFTSTSFEGGDAVSVMNLGGSYGYFVIDNMALVGSFGYAKVGDADAVTSFGIGARYYMGGMFGGVGYSIPGEEMSDLALAVGYSKMLTDNISLEPSLGYIMHSVGDYSGSSIKLNIGFGLYF
jgi:hypothetical protein